MMDGVGDGLTFRNLLFHELIETSAQPKYRTRGRLQAGLTPRRMVTGRRYFLRMFPPTAKKKNASKRCTVQRKEKQAETGYYF